MKIMNILPHEITPIIISGNLNVLSAQDVKIITSQISSRVAFVSKLSVSTRFYDFTLIRKRSEC